MVCVSVTIQPVFITSSDFISGARNYAKALQTKIVLINGQELADLMIDFCVGVIDEQTYRVNRVDPEYFRGVDIPRSVLKKLEL